MKEELAYPLRAAFEDRTVRIPDDQTIIASHRAIRKETTASGNVRFVAEHTESGHADDFWAHALALHAGKSVGASFGYDGASEFRFTSASDRADRKEVVL